ncbi:MAG: DUF2914 domain-containing protein [Epsilonproteobacteria bacterium]|nr:DUF2914 domain-containing protein [Campylobacterota bacterium]
MKKLLLIFLISGVTFAYDLVTFVTCKNIKNHTPVNITSVFSPKDKKVYAFAYFKNIEQNRLIDFVWEKEVNGEWKLYADIKLPIYAGSRWRTYSYITIRPFFEGKWRVSLMDGSETIASKEFNITKGKK